MKKIVLVALMVLCSMSFGDACLDECLKKRKSVEPCYNYCYNGGEGSAGEVEGSDPSQGGQGSQGIDDAMFPAFDIEGALSPCTNLNLADCSQIQKKYKEQCMKGCANK